MVKSDTVRVSVMPVESDTARVVYFGKVASDSVGLRVGPSCLRLLDERGVTSDVDLGVTPDG